MLKITAPFKYLLDVGLSLGEISCAETQYCLKYLHRLISVMGKI